MLFIIVLSKFLCTIHLISLFSGVSSSIESTLEPVTGMRDFNVENKSNYNDSLKVYDDYDAFESKFSIFTDISVQDNSNTYTQISNSDGVNDDYGLLEKMDTLKLSISDSGDLYKILYENNEVEKEIVYNPYNLREKSNLSREQIYNLLEGSNLQVLANSYYEMENIYNINAIFLMALNMEESGHGTSDLALLNNNIGGVKSACGGWAYFSDWNHSLEYIANLIDDMYLSEDGAYYNGTSIYDVNIRYCEGEQWAYNLNAISYELLEKVNSLKLISC